MHTNRANSSTAARRRFETLRIKAAGAWDVFTSAVNNFDANGDTNQAAAISLYTILSAIPFFILTIIVAGNIFSSQPQIQADIITAIRSFNPYFSEKLVEQLGHIESKGSLLGWVGVLVLVWLSAAIFNAVETSLNITFRSQRRRNIFISKLLAIAMIPLGWLIGAASLLVSYMAALLTAHPIVLPGGIEMSLTAASGFLLRYVVPYFVTVVFFYFLYRIIPTATVRPMVLLAGSALSAALMEIAKQFFTWYMAGYTRYWIIFGTLEPVVILILWVFYVAVIFLFCAELMYAYQCRDMFLLERVMLKPHKSYLKADERFFRRFGRFYPEGSIIFSEGDEGYEMFYVISGRVLLEKEAGRVKKVLAEVNPGQYFGEMAALINAPRAASARALQDCHLAAIDGKTFSNLLQESRDMGTFLLRDFSCRLKNTNASLEEMTGLWIRLIVILYFIVNPKEGIEEALPRLAALTEGLSGEIREVINDLRCRGILNVEEGYPPTVMRDKIWAILGARTQRERVVKETDETSG